MKSADHGENSVMSFNPFWDLSSFSLLAIYSQSLQLSIPFGIYLKSKTAVFHIPDVLSIPFGIYPIKYIELLPVGTITLSIPFGIYHTITPVYSPALSPIFQSLLGFIWISKWSKLIER